MVLNIRGTSGSGKSTLVRKVMEHFGSRFPIHANGRRQPVGYLCHADAGEPIKSLWVVGHYETVCGGCDTFDSIESVYKSVREMAAQGWNVLYEGIMVSGESKRAIDLYRDKYKLHVIALDVPIEQCLEDVKTRRLKRGNTKEFTPDRTIRRLGEVRRMMEHLKVAGVPTEWLDREAAYARALQLLGIV